MPPSGSGDSADEKKWRMLRRVTVPIAVLTREGGEREGPSQRDPGRRGGCRRGRSPDGCAWDTFTYGRL